MVEKLSEVSSMKAENPKSSVTFIFWWDSFGEMLKQRGEGKN